MNEIQRNVVDLLDYILEVEKTNREPPYQISKDAFTAYAKDLNSLPDIQANLLGTDSDIWLKIPRLQELPAPKLPIELLPWVSLSNSEKNLPKLSSSISVFKDGVKVSDENIENHPNIQELFNWYISFQWTPWSETELLRRKTIEFYNKLFLLHQTIDSGIEIDQELVWGIGCANWKSSATHDQVDYPLITQQCDIRLNPINFAIEIYPRESNPKIELDCYFDMENEGVIPLESTFKIFLDSTATPITPFDSSTYEQILKNAVASLDAFGIYDSDCDEQFNHSSNENLVVSNTWVIFSRKRSKDIFSKDVQRLKDAILEGAVIPEVIQEFVKKGSNIVRQHPPFNYRGLSSSENSTTAKDLFFPLPYNQEQVSIIGMLENNFGVVVQGPPGTGKTHSIANIICHYLALGKSVLVTSKSDTALSVLQDKLPPRIKPLSVALLSDEKQGMKQFEHSINKIASEVSSLQPMQLEQNIVRLENTINTVHSQIAAVDQNISLHAAKNFNEYPYQGRKLRAEDLAKEVVAGFSSFSWFDDELSINSPKIAPLTEDDINTLKIARRNLGNELTYSKNTLPKSSCLPIWDELHEMHQNLLKVHSIKLQMESGHLSLLIDENTKTLDKAHELVLELQLYFSTLLLVNDDAVQLALSNKLRNTPESDVINQTLFSVITTFEKLEVQRRKFVSEAIQVPDNAELDDKYTSAIDRLIAGKRAFSLPLIHNSTKRLLLATFVKGQVPAAPTDWEVIKEMLVWRKSVKSNLAQFESLAAEYKIAFLNTDALEINFTKNLNQLRIIKKILDLVYVTEKKIKPLITIVFESKVTTNIKVNDPSIIKHLIESLNAHIDKDKLGRAQSKIAQYISLIEDKQAKICADLLAVLQFRVGQVSEDVDSLKRDWIVLHNELARLNLLEADFIIVRNYSQIIEGAGAVKWAQRIIENPVVEGQEQDLVLPQFWAQAWEWRVASNLLAQIDVHSVFRSLLDNRTSLTKKLSETYQELISEKTWLGLYNNSPPIIRQALRAYLNAIQAMGSGTGLRAGRHRKAARAAMEQAYKAVPCWILPQWRISETLPSELGLFDLVIIDEASQSDIWALPAMVRGKKLLIVGDDKQVSPSAIGLAEQTILNLQMRFLSAQPHGSNMTPDKSIYDLSQVVFAGNSIMLKEHFRCVAPIIEYSNREFYNNEIQALRVPKSTERLDPPLVNVLVKGGYRVGDQNPPEAQAIICEILSILKDPSFDGRTIGVVTLLGSAQAKLIDELVSRYIPTEDIIKRKITVGAPPQFQGRERDIMMISMVLQQGNRSASNIRSQHQRFNVALSRARDRTYLFRSVFESDFASGSLNGKLLQHFDQPFTQNPITISTSKELCESTFERSVFDDLTSRGFRVKPQVKCGKFRIDLVVEGQDGRRLAIECDGDRYHGPDRWQHDMARQRVLERAGWVFWRCFASSYVRSKDTVLADLIQTLKNLDIGPLASPDEDSTAWVLHKTVEAEFIDLEQAKEQYTIFLNQSNSI